MTTKSTKTDDTEQVPVDISSPGEVDLWIQTILSEYGPPTLTRLLLAALALHAMRQDVDDLTPKVVAGLMGVTPKTAKCHIKHAVDGGWLKPLSMVKDGREWKQDFIFSWPPGLESREVYGVPRLWDTDVDEEIVFAEERVTG